MFALTSALPVRAFGLTRANSRLFKRSSQVSCGECSTLSDSGLLIERGTDRSTTLSVEQIHRMKENKHASTYICDHHPCPQRGGLAHHACGRNVPAVDKRLRRGLLRCHRLEGG